MNYCTRRSFLFLLGTFLGTHFIWYQHPFFDESFQRNSVRVGARAAWGRRAPGRSASLYQAKGFWATKELLFLYRPPPLHAGEENVIQNSPLSILNNTQRLVEDMWDQVLDLGLKYSQTRSLCIRWKKLHWFPKVTSLFFK